MEKKEFTLIMKEPKSEKSKSKSKKEHSKSHGKSYSKSGKSKPKSKSLTIDASINGLDYFSFLFFKFLFFNFQNSKKLQKVFNLVDS